MSTASTTSDPRLAKLPANIESSYWFQATSSMNWQMCMGSTLVLFVRELGASALVLGILGGITPLTSTLQLPMSQRVERIGYRKLMLSGWTARTFLLMPLAVLPLLVPAIVSAHTAIAIVLMLVFGFSVLRGLSMVSWLPWMSALVPKAERGAYLSRDRFFLSVAVVIGLLISGAFLVSHSSLIPYTAVFTIGIAAGLASLVFLSRVPDPSIARLRSYAASSTSSPTAQPTQAAARQSWSSLFQDQRYRRLVVYSSLIQIISVGNVSFITVFARERAGIPDGIVLWLAAGASLAGALALQFMRPRIDRIGSKPFMWAALAWWAIAFVMWALLASGVVPVGGALLAGLLLVVTGFFATGHEMAMTRITMNIAGAKAASAQYFALNSVAASLAAGVSPIVWGALLDVLRAAPVNNYVVFFGLNLLVVAMIGRVLPKLSDG
jgi:MFS family permease